MSATKVLVEPDPDATTPIRIQIGAGLRPLPLFTNIEPRDDPTGRTVRGHAADLPYEDGTVDIIFSNAVFEHFFAPHHLTILAEWKRVLAPDGVIFALGIPHFPNICRAYLDGARGVLTSKFNLFEVYRYTHGWPEQYVDQADWLDWSPIDHPRDAPGDWLVQLHKAIFDAPELHDLLEAAKLEHTVLEYAWPGEHLILNLGFIAGHADHGLDVFDRLPRRAHEYVDHETLTAWGAPAPVDCDPLWHIDGGYPVISP